MACALDLFGILFVKTLLFGDYGQEKREAAKNQTVFLKVI